MCVSDRVTWKQTRARRDSTWHLAQEEWGGAGEEALGVHPEGVYPEEVGQTRR